MLRHSLMLILRNFRRFKSSFLINLIGLSTGLASTLLIYLWVVDERSVDKYHEQEGRLYQVMANHTNSDRIETMEATPHPLAVALAREIPEMRHTVNLAPASWFTKFTLSVSGTTNKLKAAGQFVDTAYLEVFTLPLLSGDKMTALKDPHSILISEQLAINLFNTTENVIGKSIDWNISQFQNRAIVTGVFKQVPRQSTQQFDFLLTMEAFRDITGHDENWGNNGPSTFVVLDDHADAAKTSEKIAGFIKSKRADLKVDLFLRPYSSGYLYGRYENGSIVGGRIEYVRLFSLIAAFILLIACINFMNLSTAKASRRIKEVGIKKAVGAARITLILQYLGESLLISFLSLGAALVAVQLLLPSFNLLTGKELTLAITPFLVLSLVVIATVTGVLAGSYPALYLSGFTPAAVLKGKFTSGFGEQWARKGLVVFQFALSVIFIVGVIVVSRQIEYVQTRNLGLDKDHVLLFDKEGSIAEHQEAFLAEAATIPGMAKVATIGQNIIGLDQYTIGVEWPGKNPEENVRFSTVQVGYNLIETLGIEVLAGRSFSQDFKDGPEVIVINEEAMNVMGLTDPIGQTITFWNKPVKIIGVVKNFHYESFHEKVRPFIFRIDPEWTLYVMVRLEAGRERDALAQLEKLYARVNPGYPFNYKFIDQDYQALYSSENRVGILANYFAILAILISCLGLLGLASFTAERRKKEIGLRKVLGSSELGIIYLLSGDFTRIVIVAVVIALPLAYLAASSWLDSFAYHIDLKLWYFAGAGLGALVIAWLTVGAQAFRAARFNPTECLKEE